MLMSLEQCQARADEAAAAAEGAVLDNVRERELRSAAAWRAFANQVEAVKAGRKANEARTAAQQG